MSDPDVYYIDMPNSYDGLNFQWLNLEVFETREEAIKFAQHHFGADENGCICLITPDFQVKVKELKMSELIARLMAAVETPDDLTQDDIKCLLEDAHIVLQEARRRLTVEVGGLLAGDEVYWNDPDEGTCSGHAIFVRQHCNESVAIIKKDGVEIEVFVKELS
jgi:hypothetical protein